VAQVLASQAAFAQSPANVGTAPVSILRVAPDDPANFGFRPRRPGRVGSPPPVGTTFLVTNHTSANIALNLMAIEVKAGSNWVTQLTPHGPLMLSASNAVPRPVSTTGFIPGLTTSELLPHGAAYATISFSGASPNSGPAPATPVGVGMNYLAGQPTGAVWRVVLSAEEKLTGFAGASAHVKGYPQTRSRLALAGVTNAPVNPFSSAYSYYGKPTRVVSQEVQTQ
jgi:hypothetical protein